MGNWYYYNRHLPRLWAQMRDEMRQDDAAYFRELEAEREAEAEQREIELRVEFESEYYEYMSDPLAYIQEQHAGATYDFDGNLVSSVWVPYKGTRGGAGWQNLATGDVTYDIKCRLTEAPLDEPRDIEGRWRDPPGGDGQLTASEAGRRNR